MAATAKTAGMEAAATTERPARQRPDGARAPARRGSTLPDRASVVLFSLAAFLAVLALLAWQLRASAPRAASPRILLVRRVYETTVIETIRGSGSGTSVSQSVSSSGSGSVPVAAPTSRSSSSH